MAFCCLCANMPEETTRRRFPMLSKPVLISLLFLFTPHIRSLSAQSPQPSPSISAPRSHLSLSDFYAHDPFILADSATKTYYLYTAYSAQQSPGGHAGVVAYKSTDLKS